ncbi:MAG TPA: hypothetical protein VIO33_15520 [Burkholderiaceae bacterium]
MTPSRTLTVLSAACLCAILAACGGGGDSSEPETPAGPTFASCFDVTAGVAFVEKSTDEGGDDAGRNSVLLVKEAFEGAVRSGSVVMSDNTSTAVRSSAFYWSQESNGVRFWGFLDYDNTGSAQAKTVHSDGFTLPLAMQAGQSATLNYTDTATQLTGTSAGQVATTTRQETWTFEGFETLTLGGKTFTGTCRIKTLQTTEDGPSTLWFAKGFGLIRSLHTNTAGAVQEESVLETVTTQP